MIAVCERKYSAGYPRLPLAGIDQALQGKVAGVTVTSNSGRPGEGISIKVRGVTTINSK